MRKGFLPIVIAGLAMLAAALALGARGPDSDANPTPEEVAARTMSPFCPGLTLAECPSSQSAQLRDRIAEMVDDGWTNRQIDAWLLDSYGEAAMARPRGPLAFVVPISIVLAGGIVVTLMILRWGRTRDGIVDPETAITSRERERLNLELKAFSEGTE